MNTFVKGTVLPTQLFQIKEVPLETYYDVSKHLVTTG